MVVTWGGCNQNEASFRFENAKIRSSYIQLSSCWLLWMHRDLVLGFFKNASCMLQANGEVHVNHKTTAPFSNWNLRRSRKKITRVITISVVIVVDVMIPFHSEIQVAMGQLPTSIDLSYYPQTYHIPKMDEGVESVIGLRNGHPAISDGYFNNVSAHGMGLVSQRPLQPLHPMQTFQRWSSSTNVRYSDSERVRTRDMVPLLPLGARNEGYYDQVFGGNSN